MKVITSNDGATSWPFYYTGVEIKRDIVRKKICVIDGQGGGIGASIIKYLRETFGEAYEMIALGTHAIATAQMLKAGANRGASGENAVVCTVIDGVEWIIGPIAITWANAMLGEVTPRIAEAVMSCPGKKILLPLTKENVEMVGIAREPLPHLVQMIVERMKEENEHV